MKVNKLVRSFSKTYRLFGFAALLTCFVLIVVILAVASLNGLLSHRYAVEVFTNVYGEDWPEFLVLLLSIPSVVVLYRDVFQTV